MDNNVEQNITKIRLQILNYILDTKTDELFNNHTDKVFETRYRTNVEFEVKAYRILKTKNSMGYYPDESYILAENIAFDRSVKFPDVSTVDEVKEIINRFINTNFCKAIAGKFAASNDMMFEDFIKQIIQLNDEYSSQVTPDKDALEMKDDLIKETLMRKNGLKTINFGIKGLDNEFNGGLVKSDYCVLVARPGIGKSMLATMLAANMCKKGLNVAYFNGEMETLHILSRWLTCLTGTKLSSLIQGTDVDLIDDVYDKIKENFPNIGKFSIFTTDQLPDRKPTGTSIFKHAEKLNADVLIIDQFNQLRPSGYTKSGWESMNVISQDIKTGIQKAKIPVIVLHELNRSGDKQEDALYGSDRILHDASILLTLTNASQDNKLRPGQIMLECRKSRNTQSKGKQFVYDVDWNIGKISYVEPEQQELPDTLSAKDNEMWDGVDIFE